MILIFHSLSIIPIESEYIHNLIKTKINDVLLNLLKFMKYFPIKIILNKGHIEGFLSIKINP